MSFALMSFALTSFELMAATVTGAKKWQLLSLELKNGSYWHWS
jgi:hypothetical protein